MTHLSCLVGSYDEKLETIVDTGIQIEQTAASAINTLEDSGALALIEEGVRNLSEGLPILLRTLEAVQTVHPVVGVAVLAFKAVYTLEMTRRANDQKIVALYVEMRNMMDVLEGLTVLTPEDVNKQASDGTTINGRLTTLCGDTAEDIRACANTCVTYTKKTLIVKVLKGPKWDNQLASFVKTFTQRRAEFQFALSIHTALGVSTANRTLENVESTMKECDRRMSLLLASFEKMVSPEQRRIKSIIREHGGEENVMYNDELLQRVSKEARHVEAEETSDSSNLTGGMSMDVYSLGELKQDLSEDITVAVRRNAEIFNAKFDMQQRQIKEDMKQESDRVIQALTAGPHDQLLDPDIRDIWIKMDGKGNVKTKHFVLALRDHFTEVSMEQKKSDASTQTGAAALPVKEATVKKDLSKSYYPEATLADDNSLLLASALSRYSKRDDWTIKYLNIRFLQNIADAIDCDSSGFITISEINKFTASRPNHWSLLKWIAYWAIGSISNSVRLATRIRYTFNQMFSLLPMLLPANQGLAGAYLNSIWKPVVTFLEPFRTKMESDDNLDYNFQSYNNSEHTRMKSNLQAVRYYIDGIDTLELVAGDGRIETRYCEIVDMLLQRHLDIFYLAQTILLDNRELIDMTTTFLNVCAGMQARYQELKSYFVHQSINLEGRFKNLFQGIFQFEHTPATKWSTDMVKQFRYEDSPREFSDRAMNAGEVLKYPQKLATGSHTLNKVIPVAQNTFPCELQEILSGTWGYAEYEGNECSCMKTFEFHPDTSRDRPSGFIGRTSAIMAYDIEIRGQADRLRDGFLRLNWTMTSSRSDVLETKGTAVYDDQTKIFTGTWGYKNQDLSKQGASVLLCQTKSLNPKIMTSLHGPAPFQYDGEEGHWKLYLNSIIKGSHYGFPRLRAVQVDKIPVFEASLLKKRLHQGLSCDNCHKDLSIDRIVCLDCLSTDGMLNTLEFCGDEECFSASVSTHRSDLKASHSLSHTLVKLRKPTVMVRHFGFLNRQAISKIRHGIAYWEDFKNGNAQDIRTFPSHPDPAWDANWCWYCIDCPGDTYVHAMSITTHSHRMLVPTFISNHYDQEGGFSRGIHIRSHSLVSIKLSDKPASLSKSDLESLRMSVESMNTQLVAWMSNNRMAQPQMYTGVPPVPPVRRLQRQHHVTRSEQGEPQRIYNETEYIYNGDRRSVAVPIIPPQHIYIETEYTHSGDRRSVAVPSIPDIPPSAHFGQPTTVPGEEEIASGRADKSHTKSVDLKRNVNQNSNGYESDGQTAPSEHTVAKGPVDKRLSQLEASMQQIQSNVRELREMQQINNWRSGVQPDERRPDSSSSGSFPYINRQTRSGLSYGTEKTVPPASSAVGLNIPNGEDNEGANIIPGRSYLEEELYKLRLRPQAASHSKTGHSREEAIRQPNYSGDRCSQLGLISPKMMSGEDDISRKAGGSRSKLVNPRGSPNPRSNSYESHQQPLSSEHNTNRGSMDGRHNEQNASQMQSHTMALMKIPQVNNRSLPIETEAVRLNTNGSAITSVENGHLSNVDKVTPRTNGTVGPDDLHGKDEDSTTQVDANFQRWTWRTRLPVWTIMFAIQVTSMGFLAYYIVWVRHNSGEVAYLYT
ncbi:hypothetical protein K439DRAFT_1620875 [Ramaria rubella]|nr:hypothetical protein K439DRAFT_1620875 [Ramaria rubella]